MSLCAAVICQVSVASSAKNKSPQQDKSCWSTTGLLIKVKEGGFAGWLSCAFSECEKWSGDGAGGQAIKSDWQLEVRSELDRRRVGRHIDEVEQPGRLEKLWHWENRVNTRRINHPSPFRRCKAIWGKILFWDCTQNIDLIWLRQSSRKRFFFLFFLSWDHREQ